MSKFDDCEFPSCLGTLVCYNLSNEISPSLDFTVCEEMRA